MKSIFKGAMVASVAAMGLTLAACDSPAENAAEDRADAVRDATAAQADAMEHEAETLDGAAEEQMEAEAEALENAGEEKAEAIEESAEGM
ncbi:hypothetical protein V5F89_05210 [Pelagerythrobacter marensis]|uniref:Lipoprotein n=1 Tax=Pelagerythrobacter marensis TaxID=543877 RepID=A0ABZ2DDA1_9SPHN